MLRIVKESCCKLHIRKITLHAYQHLMDKIPQDLVDRRELRLLLSQDDAPTTQLLPHLLSCTSSNNFVRPSGAPLPYDNSQHACFNFLPDDGRKECDYYYCISSQKVWLALGAAGVTGRTQDVSM